MSHWSCFESSVQCFYLQQNMPWLSPVLSQRVCYAVYFHEEIESSVTVVIYFLNDNLLAKSLSVIAKSPAWLVGEAAYPLEALMRWTKMQFGGVECGGCISQRCVHPAHNAINFSSEVSGVFLLRCVSQKRKNTHLILGFCERFPMCECECVCMCVFLSRSCPRMMFLACCMHVWQQLHVWQELECMCGLNSVCVWLAGCVCVCLQDGMGCMFTGLQSGAGWRPAETMGLENGVCLCVPLLSQQETRQLSPLSLSLSLCLSHSLTDSVFSLVPFSFSL